MLPLKILKSILQLTRIKEWWYLLGIPFLGMLYNNSLNFQMFLSFSLCPLVFLAVFAYSWNTFYDRNYESALLKVVFSSFLLSILGFFFLKRIEEKIVYLFLFILVFFYSFPYIALKRIPFISTLCNTIASPLLLVFGVGGINIKIWKLFSLLLFLFFVAQLLHELADLKCDRKKNISTTVSIIRERSTVIIIISTLLFSLFYAFFLEKIIFLGVGIMVISFITALIIQKSEKLNYNFLRRRYRQTGLLIGILWLIYFYFQT